MGTASQSLEGDSGTRRERPGRRNGGTRDWMSGEDQYGTRDEEIAEKNARLTNAIGWFSVGLGLAQIAAPRGVARLIGVRDDGQTTAIMRTLGMRELASGIGILSQDRPARWMWARVAGDVMDLALLGSALNADGTRRGRTAAATAAVLGVAALDVIAGQQLNRQPSESETETSDRATPKIPVSKSITVNGSPEEVYEFWHRFENLPRFMRHLESVEVIDERRSHWKAKAPAGRTVEWDAEITEDRPNELIAWRSVENADVRNEGRVTFRPAPGGRGTEVTVQLRYDPPAGAVGKAVAMLFHEEPSQQIQEDLRVFKQVMEIGEVMLSDATVRRGPHPARPDDSEA